MKRSNIIKPIFLRRGTPRGRHPIMRELEVSVADYSANAQPPIFICESEIDLKTGKSSVCEHRIYYRWA